MEAYICMTCGTQYAPTAVPPAHCLVCEEERQYVPSTGQRWTTLPKLRQTHMATFRDDGGLIGIGTAPNFGIGQRALLVPSPAGNVLWDCISLIDDTMVRIINALGGLSAIAISHPHYYTTLAEWSHAFGDIPVYLHEADAEWVMRSAPGIQFWKGDAREIAPGLTLVRTGGHFEGGTVMHWAQGAGGKGAILSGDLLQVVADRKFLGFMRSYPNFIPLGEKAVRAVAATIEPYAYYAIYGAFWDRVIKENARETMAKSVERHIKWLNSEA